MGKSLLLENEIGFIADEDFCTPSQCTRYIYDVERYKLGSDEGPLEELTVSDVTNLHFNFKQSLEINGIFLQ